jgi:hypothetical protein
MCAQRECLAHNTVVGPQCELNLQAKEAYGHLSVEFGQRYGSTFAVHNERTPVDRRIMPSKNSQSAFQFVYDYQ